MGYKEIRKLIRIGKISKAVILPKPWLDFHGDEATAELTLLGDAILIIAPKGLEDKARKLLKISEEQTNSDEAKNSL